MTNKGARKKKTASQKRNSGRSFKLDHWLSGLLIFLAAVTLYWPTLSFGYVLDDTIVIAENRFVQQGWEGLWKIFTTESFTGFLGEQKNLVAGARYRPLSLATFAVEYANYGLNPANSHFINSILYGLTALLLFRLLFLFFPKDKQRKWYWSVPFIASLLFVFHPIHTEVVANIKGRDEILALLFSLATLFFSLQFFRKKSWVYLLLSGLCFFLGLLAKENSITFLAIVPLSAYFFTETRPRSLIIASTPLLVIALLYLWIRTQATGALFSSQENSTLIMNNHFLGVAVWDKYATITYTLGLYVKLLFFPHPLTHDYYPYHIPILGWLDWRVQLSLFVNLGLLAVAYMGFWKKKIFSWSILFYFITLSIVSNILFFVGAAMNERFIYMSSVGFCVWLGFVLVKELPEWVQERRLNWLPALLSILILAGYGVKTTTRIPAWKDEISLNRAAVQVSKNSARANQFMGYSLYRQALEIQDATSQKALFDEATVFVDKALSIVPYYQDAITTKAGLLAGYYQQDGRLSVLLDGFYQLLRENHVNFFDQYLEYLNGRAPAQPMLDFYHKTSMEIFVPKQQYLLAEKYLNYGLQSDNTNQQLLEDKMMLYSQMGNIQQADALAQQIQNLYPESKQLRAYLNQRR